MKRMKGETVFLVLLTARMLGKVLEQTCEGLWPDKWRPPLIGLCWMSMVAASQEEVQMGNIT